MIPFMDLKALHEPLKEEILERWGDILDTAGFVGGPYVAAFETNFAKWVGTDCAVSVSSGTDALRLALLAMGVGPGDEVITVPNTFIATTEAISQCGALPVFVDVEPDTALMDPNKLRAAVTNRTKVILPVHLYGQMANMTAILAIAADCNLLVLEDACQAIGAWHDNSRAAGSVGDAACFSFYPGKNLGACGEGGMVTTNSPEIAERVAILRNHGSVSKYQHEVEGYNARMDAVQAAALDVKLRYLDVWTLGRQSVAANYEANLQVPAIKLPVVSLGSVHAYHLYVVRIAGRGQVMDKLKEAGIGCGLHYPTPLHMQEAYQHLGHRHGDFPHAELWAERGLSLPMFPTMTETQVIAVCHALKAAVKE